MNSRAGQPAQTSDLVDVHALLAAYYKLVPDVSLAEQRVVFGTSGHRGSSLDSAFNETHIAAITQAIVEYRTGQGITGPLFIGGDTHALSRPAETTALEVLVANGVEALVDEFGDFVPTPAISHAIIRYNASIAAGEQSGKLADVLAHLTEFVGSQEKARRKVQLALLYPALLAVVSLLMISLLMVYVVPDIVKVFVSRGAELPFLTRALIALSAFVQTFGVYVLIALVVIGVAWNRWLAIPANSRRFAQFLLQTPPFAGFTRHLNAARFAGSLATLVRSDVPLVEALQASAAVTPNRYARERALLVAARVREGSSLRKAMADADVFPPLLLAIVASGEQSGKLGQGLERAAQDLEQELESLVAALVALVEPGVLLVMGGVVLLMVLSILMPIVNLNNLAGL